MATTLDILQAAYLRSSRSTPGVTAQDGELLAFLGRVYASYYLLMAKASPDRFRSPLELTLGGAPATAAIPSTVRDIVFAKMKATSAEVTIAPYEEAARAWNIAPVLIWLGTAVTSRAGVGDPINGDVVVLLVLLAATYSATLTFNLDVRFTDEYTELLVLEVAAYLAMKDSNRDPEEYKKLLAERGAAQAMFLRSNGYRTTAMTSPAAKAIQTARGDGVDDA